MATLCCTALLGHYTLIRAYAMAEASAIQPFAYFQLIFVALIGLYVFDETMRPNVAIGTGIVVAAGVFALWRQRLRGKRMLIVGLRPLFARPCSGDETAQPYEERPLALRTVAANPARA